MQIWRGFFPPSFFPISLFLSPLFLFIFFLFANWQEINDCVSDWADAPVKKGRFGVSLTLLLKTHQEGSSMWQVRN